MITNSSWITREKGFIRTSPVNNFSNILNGTAMKTANLQNFDVIATTSDAIIEASNRLARSLHNLILFADVNISV